MSRSRVVRHAPHLVGAGWILTLVVAACGKGGDKPAADKGSGGGGAAPAGDPFGKLEVTVDGKPAAMKHAFVKRQPDGSFQLRVTEQGGSCNALLSSMAGTSPGTTAFTLDVVPRLAADGTAPMTVTSVFMGPPTTADPGATAKIEGRADAGTRVAVELGFTATGGHGEKLSVHGPFVAEGCGEPDTTRGPGVPKVAHPSAATMTIAGRAFPVRGAVKLGDDVVLLDFPKDCSATTWYMGARLRRSGTTWFLDGNQIATASQGDDPALTATLGATGTSDDGPTVQVTLGGAGKVGDYPVALEGTIEALDCTTPAPTP
ncbi:MAG: hypothetical protein H6708_19430 [Kofleriaceae bacterium]|nr:hypothetical protein [Kofleriaceae bacterium]